MNYEGMELYKEEWYHSHFFIFYPVNEIYVSQNKLCKVCDSKNLLLNTRGEKIVQDRYHPC